MPIHDAWQVEISQCPHNLHTPSYNCDNLTKLGNYLALKIIQSKNWNGLLTTLIHHLCLGRLPLKGQVSHLNHLTNWRNKIIASEIIPTPWFAIVEFCSQKEKTCHKWDTPIFTRCKMWLCAISQWCKVTSIENVKITRRAKNEKKNSITFGLFKH